MDCTGVQSVTNSGKDSTTKGNLHSLILVKGHRAPT